MMFGASVAVTSAHSIAKLGQGIQNLFLQVIERKQQDT